MQHCSKRQGTADIGCPLYALQTRAKTPSQERHRTPHMPEPTRACPQTAHATHHQARVRAALFLHLDHAPPQHPPLNTDSFRVLLNSNTANTMMGQATSAHDAPRTLQHALQRGADADAQLEDVRHPLGPGQHAQEGGEQPQAAHLAHIILHACVRACVCVHVCVCVGAM